MGTDLAGGGGSGDFRGLSSVLLEGPVEGVTQRLELGSWSSQGEGGLERESVRILEMLTLFQGSERHGRENESALLASSEKTGSVPRLCPA